MNSLIEAKSGNDMLKYVAKAIAIRVVITVGAVIIAEAIIKQIDNKKNV